MVKVEFDHEAMYRELKGDTSVDDVPEVVEGDAWKTKPSRISRVPLFFPFTHIDGSFGSDGKTYDAHIRIDTPAIGTVNIRPYLEGLPEYLVEKSEGAFVPTGIHANGFFLGKEKEVLATIIQEAVDIDAIDIYVGKHGANRRNLSDPANFRADMNGLETLTNTIINYGVDRAVKDKKLPVNPDLTLYLRPK